MEKKQKNKLGKKDARIISWELLCTLNSIRLFPGSSGKPDVTLDNFTNYEIKEFNLETASISESEYKTIIRLLGICQDILKEKEGCNSSN